MTLTRPQSKLFSVCLSNGDRWTGHAQNQADAIRLAQCVLGPLRITSIKLGTR